MKTAVHRIALRAIPALVVALLASGAAVANPDVTQTFHLSPGWNAIWLEVDPVDDDPAAVFQSVPLAGVWYWSVPDAPPDTLPDPVDGLPQAEGWLHFFPSPPESFTNDLFSVQANRVYLVQIGGGAPATLTVSGRPSVTRQAWVPDAFNLVGVGLVPGSEPTYGDYFEPSPAHRAQPIYTLDPAGTWRLTDPATRMTAGQAFWVFTAAGSDWPGPIGLDVPTGDGVLFAAIVSGIDLGVRNRGDSPRTYRVNLLGDQNAAFAYRTESDPADGVLDFTWTGLGGGTTAALAVNEDWQLRLGVQLDRLAARVCTFESEQPGRACSGAADCPAGECVPGSSATIEVLDGAGSRRLVPLLVEHAVGGGPGKAATAADVCQTGLWVGTISVSSVAYAHCDQTQDGFFCPISPVPTDPVAFAEAGNDPNLYEGQRNTFQQRVILHQDDGGQVRMLQQAIEMFEADTSGVDGARGRPVLVTRDDQIPLFGGATLRDGVPVGRRVSTVAFRWDEDPPPYQPAGGPLLPPAQAGYDGSGLRPTVPGSLAPGTMLTFSIRLPGKEPDGPPSPHNPYYHRYHPDHGVVTLQAVCEDGPFRCQACSSDADCETGRCNFTGVTCAADIPTITRDITFTFDTEDSEGGLDFGCGRLAGTYRETLGGVAGGLFSAGRFRLERISTIGVLNPEPR